MNQDYVSYGCFIQRLCSSAYGALQICFMIMIMIIFSKPACRQLPNLYRYYSSFLLTFIYL